MQNISTRTDRRAFLASASLLPTLSSLGSTIELFATNTMVQPVRKKRVAAIVTIYRKDSHADVLVGKILEGWKQDGGDGPQLELASLYVDQFPQDDLARGLAKKFGFPISATIEEAISLGTGRVAVDGVLSIGEHGDYPTNAKGQHLYPRKRFFEEIAKAFEKYSQVVPVFNDKHPGPVWEDAEWMYRRAKELRIPWMAGSSIPVSFRSPDKTMEWGGELESCLAIGYSGLDVYGFHTLDFLQSMVERRRGAETGVRWVQCLPLESLANLLDAGTITPSQLRTGLEICGAQPNAIDGKQASDTALFLIQYEDGLLTPVLMLGSKARSIGIVCKTRGAELIATRAEERVEPRYPHFAYLLKGVERMIHTGRPTYPVERTILSAGMLDRLLTSKSQNYVKILTPELRLRYEPVDYPYAPHIDLQRAVD